MKLFTLVFITLVLVKDSINKNHENNKLKTKNSPIFQPNQPQSPQNCDLICPGQPPLELPSNFMQNCQPVTFGSTSTTPNIVVSTTQKVTSGTPKSTTSGSNLTSSTAENTESAEEEEGTSTEKPVKRKSKNQNKAKPHENKLKNQVETIDIDKKHQRVRQSKENHAKYGTSPNQEFKLVKFKHNNFKSQKVVLRMKDKTKMFKNNKHFKERYRLDGCYVICPDNQGTVGQNVGPIVSPVTEAPTPNDYDVDNYVEGEDSPIEIIYVPPNIVQQVPQIISQGPPTNNVPQNVPSVPQINPQTGNIPQSLGNILPPQMVPNIPQNVLPHKSPFDVGDTNPFGQFLESAPWDFGPFFRAHKKEKKS